MSSHLRAQALGQWNLPYKSLIMIAGPCSAETPEQMLEAAQGLAHYDISVFRAGLWKPRTRPGAFEGVGAKGLRWLKDVGKEVLLPVATEVATPRHVEQCLKAGIDLLWIGARTTTNPFAIQAIADAVKGVDIPVMIKNPMNPDVELWIGALERLSRAGVTRLAAIHRGFSLVEKDRFRNPPLWRIPIELRRRVPHVPMVCDPSHIAGSARLVAPIAREAVDLLFDGLMIEVHSNPPAALSDSKQQLTPRQYGQLVRSLQIRRVSTDDRDFRQHIAELRREIDGIDDDLIGLLARRMDVALRIGDYKKDHSVSLLQPDRWKEILRSRIESGKRNKLNPDLVKGVYELIHEAALDLQEKRQ